MSVIVPSKSVKKMNLGFLNGEFIAGRSAELTMMMEAVEQSSAVSWYAEKVFGTVEGEYQSVRTLEL